MEGGGHMLVTVTLWLYPRPRPQTEGPGGPANCQPSSHQVDAHRGLERTECWQTGTSVTHPIRLPVSPPSDRAGQKVTRGSLLCLSLLSARK